MSTRLIRVLAILTMLLADRAARADYPRLGVYVGPFVGGNIVLRKWDFGPQGESYYLNPSHGADVGLRLGLQLASRFFAEAEVAYLPVPAGNSINTALAFDVNLAFHILRGNWTPVIEAGAGGYYGRDKLAGDLDARVHVGAGVRGLVLPWLAVRLDVRDVFTDGFDKTNIGGNNLEILAGVDLFAWRAMPLPDRDHDDVPDAKDRCPDTAGLPALEGCPDRDEDGVADDKDRCPEQPGPVANKGCPDRDLDGVIDPDDQCPEVAAGRFPDANKPGCPADRDGDGVTDEQDQCVDVSAGKRPDPARRGCPLDRDGDGFPDESDACPAVKGVASDDPAKNGCPPDRDGDTIPDAVDACPDKAGAPDPDPKKNGCPGLVEIKKDSIVILQKIYFDTDSHRLSKKSYAVLDAVVNAVKSLPEENRVSVEGHTDERGSGEHNRSLSERRAASVVEYLVKKGIAAARLESHGYGTERPLADNSTEAGREQNRRVEFRIITPDSK